MPKLLTESSQFRDSDLTAWRQGDYGLLAHRTVSLYIRHLLIEKCHRRKRPSRRFFGEAFVAARTDHVDGWYGSFKWLRCFPSGADDEDRWFHKKFKDALGEHFPNLPHLHKEFDALSRLLRVKPVPPDLWLIVRGRRGRLKHRFIEVKLPGDKLAPRQVAGLAVIATCLPRDGKRVSTSVISLHSETTNSAPMTGDKVLFAKYCRDLRRAGFDRLARR